MEHDYKQIGFKAGLEIHQQLDVGSKLFCKCPAFLRNDETQKLVYRKLHPVAGESGEVDSAVAYEATLRKEYYYQGYNDTTCLVEYDDSPPYEISQAAL